MKFKSFLRWLLPCGFIEARHRRFKLSRLGLANSRKTEIDVNTCRYDLWPMFLRNDPTPWVLVDVGANVGEFLSAAINLRQFQAVFAFEPQPCCQADLSKILRVNPNLHLISAAVGRVAGSLELHVTANSRMASGLRPDEAVKSAYSSGDFTIIEKIPVPMVTLDTAIPESLEIGLLKLDVQGFELEVLAGAPSVLKRTKAILIEVNYVCHYENGATFQEIYSNLHALGFRLYGISAPYSSKDYEPLWADAVFVNSSYIP